MDWTRIHASVYEKRLFQSDQWELLLQSLSDALNLDAVLVDMLAMTVISYDWLGRELLERHHVRLLLALMQLILLDLCL